MSKLSDKLRELAEWLDVRNSQPFFHPPTTVYYDFRMRIGPLLSEAERLERLIVNDKDVSIVTQGAFNHAIAQRDKAIEKANHLEAQNARLRDLVREAYREGLDCYCFHGEMSNEEFWEQSKAKAELDEMEDADASQGH